MGSTSLRMGPPASVRDLNSGRARVDVLVDAEQVGGIVFPLHRHQALVVPPECSAYELRVLRETGEIEVGLASAELLHRIEETPRPGDVGLCLHRIRPVSKDLQEK